MNYKFNISFICLLLSCSQFLFAQNINNISSLEPFDKFFTMGVAVEHQKDRPEIYKQLETIVATNGNKQDDVYFNFIKNAVVVNNNTESIAEKMAFHDDYLKKVVLYNDYFLNAMIYAGKAQCYKRAAIYEKALENYLYACDELEKDPKHEYYKCSYTLYELGLMFYQYKDYNNALKFASLVVKSKYHYDPNLKNKFMAKVTLNLLGEVYRKKEQYDSAMYWHQQCLDICTKNLDTIWTALATACIGDVYFDAQDFATAKIQYATAIKLFKQLDCKALFVENNVANVYCNMASISVKQKNTTLALQYINDAKKYLISCKDAANWLKYYATLIEYNKAFKSLDNSFIAVLDSMELYEKILGKELDEKKKISTEASIAYNKKDLENKLNAATVNETKMLLYSCIAALILLGSIAVLYTRKRKLRYKLQQEKTERENEKVNEALKLAQIQLEDFTKNLQEKNKLIEQFAVEIESFKIVSNEKVIEQEKIIDNLKQSVILTEENWINYKKLFDQAYPNFSNDVKAQYPSITTAELRYVMFTKLNLTNKEMAALLGIGLEGVRSLKHRVKQKVG